MIEAPPAVAALAATYSECSQGVFVSGPDTWTQGVQLEPVARVRRSAVGM